MSIIRDIQSFTSLGLEVVSYSERFDDNFEATVTIKTTWDSRVDVLRSVLGGPDANQVFDLPVFYDGFLPTTDEGEEPPVPPMTAVCVGASIESFTGDLPDSSEAVAKPSHALIDFEFMVPTWEHTRIGERDHVLTEQFESSAEFLTLGTDGLSWSDPSGTDQRETVKSDEAPNKIVYSGTWIVTRHYVTEAELIAENRFLDLIGTVNENALSSPKFDLEFAPQSLMFLPPKPMPRSSPKGPYWDVEFSMRWRPSINQDMDEIVIPQGHNLAHRGGLEQPMPLYTDKDTGRSDNFLRTQEIKHWGNWLPPRLT